MENHFSERFNAVWVTLAVSCIGPYYRSMASSATKTYKAVLALFSGPRSHPYDSADIAVAAETEAIDRAWEWARDPKREVVPGTRLVVTIDGKSILNEPLDWTNAARP
jgi:hypothetical protein